MKEMERAQLADIRLSMWETRPGSPQSSETSGIFTAADTMTDVGGEEFQDTTDLSEPGGSHRKHGDASKPQHMSETVTDLRRQLAETRQELKAIKERMHRLEITHKKAWSEMEALKPGPTLKSDVPATPNSSCRDARADTDLHHACEKGYLAEVKRILDTGRADVNSRDGDGRTPVMLAADEGHSDVVELLVSQGADVSLVDDYHDNILHLACIGRNRKTVEFVLSLDGVDVNSRGFRSWTPVMLAARWRRRDVVELLVSQGADVSLVDDDDNNILHYACMGGHRKTVEFVLSLDGVDVNARNNYRKTAADVAGDWRNSQVLDLLVSRGTQCCDM
ncbi:ankyrin repeat domain-containing protein 7-like isoform X2 [Haliotis asinina]|uniref:ankyrin repeat domain-containing protein 7-like isoform X2 n=1 Tax=Haliotis asinina TaxID=109174 RepID=UPI003531EE66